MVSAPLLKPSRKYRVVQWATGSMGRTALRRVIDHPDLELVGVYVYDSRKVGVDAGEIARRPPTGVRATHRIGGHPSLCARTSCCTCRASRCRTRSRTPTLSAARRRHRCDLDCGFHHPACHGLAYAGPLLEACKRGESTLAGVGLNPGFIAEQVATLLTGLCAQLQSIACYEVADASSMPAPEFVFGLMGFGADPAQRDVTREPIAGCTESCSWRFCTRSRTQLGSRVASLTPEHTVTLAPREMRIRAGTIAQGTVAATQWRWRARLESGVEVLHSVTWTADPAMHGASHRERPLGASRSTDVRT